MNNFQTLKTWPFEEARQVLKKLGHNPDPNKPIIFETGFGASGLPHIGTFAEVFRTTLVLQAFQKLSDLPVKLIVFSDDMDGLRKVPTNIPNQEMMINYIDRPLTDMPDPFGEQSSFGAYNNAKLQSFLDAFEFEYELYSSTEKYKEGVFNDALLKILEHYDAINNVILPTLGEERRVTYSPFMPICNKTGKVLASAVQEVHPDRGTLTYKNSDGELVETKVTDGHCKLQWKVDWAMRWYALGVDYEMAGKDLSESVKLSSKITRILGGKPPVGFSYELFLDQDGKKISKSSGNGITVDEWLHYAPRQSLALFMYQNPKRAKRLYFDMIPKMVDEYYSHISSFHTQDDVARLKNPVYYLFNGDIPHIDMPVSFSLLLNLATVCKAENKDILWGFVEKYAPGSTPDTHPELDHLLGFVVNYYHDFVAGSIQKRAATDFEKERLNDVLKGLLAFKDGKGGPDGDMSEATATPEALQSVIYGAGRDHYDNLRSWFQALYEILLGQSQGPRLGSFIKLFGIDSFNALIIDALGAEKE